jgi:hypothetical protein
MDNIFRKLSERQLSRKDFGDINYCNRQAKKITTRIGKKNGKKALLRS